MSELYGFKKNLEKVQVRSKSESAAKSHIVPTLIDRTTVVAPATRYEFANRTIPELANWNVVVLECTCANISQNLIFFRAASVQNYIIDALSSIKTRGGYYVDWANNRIRVRWVDGNSSYSSLVPTIRAVYGLVQNVNVVDQDTEDEPSDEGEDIDITGLTEEVQGIRIGADGTIYETAGEAVREQYNRLAEMMDVLNVEDAVETIQNAVDTAIQQIETAGGLILDPTLTKSDKAAPAKTVGDKIEKINTGLNEVKNILEIERNEPFNKIDPSALATGRYLYNGTFQENESYKTTDYIAVNNGDVLRLFKTSNNDGVNTERTTGERIALFDANKTYLGVSGQYPCNVTNGYTVSNENAKYIRLSYSSSFVPIELTINTGIHVGNFVEYFEAETVSKRLDNIENQIVMNAKQIIDCWGDSRTDMSDDGTSFCDYLGTLLGNSWIVSNRGISGQASGQVSARYGSNEIYLTLENNRIAASGSTLITAWKVTTGTDTNLRGGDSSYGVHGTLNGVSGKYIHTTDGNINFVRDYDGAAVKVKPNTKLIPDPYFNAEHCQILWCGKNDFSYAYPNVVSGIEGNYDGMVSKIPHDKFIILGETNSIGESYLPDHSNRGYVDAINAYLAEKYPDNYIDIQAELIENGLTLEGITPTVDDESNIVNGWIPDSLMWDATHPNQYGREAIAKIIYAWMQDKGWV